MKRTAIILSAIAILFARGQVAGQEAAEEPNVHHDKLKVLEPIIGTWRFEGTNEETGAKWEWITTASWSETKKMILVESKRRGADQEWQQTRRDTFVWNEAENRIEFYAISPRRGTVGISEAVFDNGTLRYPRIRSTTASSFTTDRTDTVTAKTWTAKFHNVKNAEGEKVDDFEFALTRMKK